MTARERILTQSDAPRVPKDLITAPLFPPKKQTSPMEIQVRDVKWSIGIPEPSTDKTPSPALDIRHARACFTLLSFRDPNKPELNINFSMNDFCKRYAETQGGRYSHDLLDVILDLRRTWIRRTLPNGTIHKFTILGFVSIREKNPRKQKTNISNPSELWLDHVSLHPNFFALFKEVSRIRIDVLNSITSPLAQSIYSFIPSRAIHHTKEDPFEITATKLLEQLGEKVPEKKADRKKKFATKRDGRASIVAQLDGLELIKGRLRVDVVPTSDKSDWKLLFWADGATEITLPSRRKLEGSNSKLLDAYLKYRGDKRGFDKLMKRKTPLNYYQMEVLEMAGIDYHHSADFLEMAKTIIGEGHFEMILAELKNDVNEGQTKIKDPARLLNFRLRYAVENPS